MYTVLVALVLAVMVFGLAYIFAEAVGAVL